MKYKLKLKCYRCNRQSDCKEYDKSEQEMKQIVHVCQTALMQPQYIICPQCRGLFSVKPVVFKEN